MKEIAYNKVFERMTDAFVNGGAFLSCRGKSEDNLLTIGWASMGYNWRKPTFTAMVRLSRHSHKLIEENRVFTVSVPREGTLKEALLLCGTKSGRDMNKFEAAGLSKGEAQKVNAPIVAGCDLHIECKIVYSADMKRENIAAFVDDCYKDDDMHTMYFAEIVACYTTD